MNTQHIHPILVDINDPQITVEELQIAGIMAKLDDESDENTALCWTDPADESLRASLIQMLTKGGITELVIRRAVECQAA